MVIRLRACMTMSTPPPPSSRGMAREAQHYCPQNGKTATNEEMIKRGEESKRGEREREVDSSRDDRIIVSRHQVANPGTQSHTCPGL